MLIFLHRYFTVQQHPAIKHKFLLYLVIKQGATQLIKDFSINQFHNGYLFSIIQVCILLPIYLDLTTTTITKTILQSCKCQVNENTQNKK